MLVLTLGFALSIGLVISDQLNGNIVFKNSSVYLNSTIDQIFEEFQVK